jgi:hypothetical protein
VSSWNSPSTVSSGSTTLANSLDTFGTLSELPFGSFSKKSELPFGSSSQKIGDGELQKRKAY